MENNRPQSTAGGGVRGAAPCSPGAQRSGARMRRSSRRGGAGGSGPGPALTQVMAARFTTPADSPELTKPGAGRGRGDASRPPPGSAALAGGCPARLLMPATHARTHPSLSAGRGAGTLAATRGRHAGAGGGRHAAEGGGQAAGTTAAAHTSTCGAARRRSLTHSSTTPHARHTRTIPRHTTTATVYGPGVGRVSAPPDDHSTAQVSTIS